MSTEYTKKVKGFEIGKNVTNDKFEIYVRHKDNILLDALYEKIMEWLK